MNMSRELYLLLDCRRVPVAPVELTRRADARRAPVPVYTARALRAFVNEHAPVDGTRGHHGKIPRPPAVGALPQALGADFGVIYSYHVLRNRRAEEEVLAAQGFRCVCGRICHPL